MSARLRPALAVGLVFAVACTGIASAATKKAAARVCNLITDARGDAAVVTSQPGMDIITADIASNAKLITAVIRLAAAPTAPNPQAPGGTDYYFSFTAPGSAAPQFLHASLPPVGAATFATGQTTTVGGQNTSTDDAPAASGSIAGTIVTITASTSAFGGRVSLKPGTKLTGLTVDVYAQVGVPGVGGLLQNADTAAGAKPYIAGTPSCVVPGR
ncbi:MAG: hypothetical protein NVS3B26_02910 [Mycobacteriales bacterium]